MYAAGTAGNGSAPIPLLSAAISTDTSGAFSVAAGTYDCPAAGSMLYLVSSGGQIGTQSANAAIRFTTVVGACGGVGSATNLLLDERTTVATVEVLRPFLAAGGQLGSTATNKAGLALGVAQLANLIDQHAGTIPGPGFPANGTAPVAKMYALANALHGCAAAPSSGASACTDLFSAVAGSGAAPTNTLDAMLAIANQPGTGVSQIYTLATHSPIFMPPSTGPFLTAAPLDWTVALAFRNGGMSGPTSVSVDSTGKLWVANYFGVASLFANSGAPLLSSGITGYGLYESFGGAVDASDRMWITNEETTATVNNGFGSVSVLNPSGPALPGSSQLTAGGLSFPIALAFDRSGNAWVVDSGNGHLTLFDPSGTPLSGATGFTSGQLGFPSAVAVDSQGSAWVANESTTTVTKVARDGSSFLSFTVGDGPAAVAVDAADNVWAANYRADSMGLVSAGGQVLSNSGYTGGGLAHPTGLAVDGAGTVWVANYRGAGISAMAGATAAVPGAALSPGGGWGSDMKLTEAFGVAVDGAGNVWVTSYGDDRLVEFVGAAAPVRTPLLGGVRVP